MLFKFKIVVKDDERAFLFRDGRFEASAAVHTGVAISLRQGGLIAPAIHVVSSKSLEQLMRDLTDLVQRDGEHGQRVRGGTSHSAVRPHRTPAMLLPDHCERLTARKALRAASDSLTAARRGRELRAGATSRRGSRQPASSTSSQHPAAVPATRYPLFPIHAIASFAISGGTVCGPSNSRY